MKDGKSLLLLSLVIALLTTWVYHIYDKNQYARLQAKEVLVKDTTGMAEAIKDSLQQYYAAASPDPAGPAPDGFAVLTADSLRQQLETRLAEIGRLRKTLSNRNITKEELTIAKNKINELRSEIDEMKAQQTTLEEERKHLTGELDNLSNDMKGLEESLGKLDAENKELKEIVYNASTLVASDLRFAVMDVKGSGDNEVETSKANRADKFVVSFIVQNNIAQFNNTEVMVVITDPDGQTVTNTVWASGIFEVKKEGRKTYTRKLKFEYEKSEQKRLIFSLDYENFIKGTYKLQLYHNGIQIGETAKTLS